MRLFFLFGIVLATFMVTPILFAASPAFAVKQGIEQCMSADSASERNTCYDRLCPFSASCARLLVTAATEIRGPIMGTFVLQDLFDRNDRTVTKDGHDLAHQIGRTAARVSAGDPNVFLVCPDAFFLGCKHGFFEAMLGELGSSVDAASQVCEKAPLTERVFCFHGMGHGIMMAQANDIYGSLLVCDKLKGAAAMRGCYQGVFMENVNAVGRGEARTGTFDSADVLAPCNRIDEKYRTECYGQHADYILKSLSGSLLSATQACERAGKKSWMSSCIRHLGQNMTTYDYQTKYLGNFDLSTAAMGALTLCARFPVLRQADCRTGAAHNFMLYDQPSQAITFCNLTGDPQCPGVVIPYLNRPLYSPEDRVRICADFTDPVVRKTCLNPVLFPFKRELTGTVIISLLLCGILVLLMRSRVTSKVLQ